jgi:sialic acid synthase SpsE
VAVESAQSHQKSEQQKKERQIVMTTEIKNGQLIITIPLQAPRPSASGKTLVVATTGGNKATTAIVEGKPVVVGLNAYIAK